jgi:putative ABC transport system ATP-binding protein
MKNPLLSLRKITKSYQLSSESIAILHQVNLEAATGESVAIIGPSGSGKTTLLSIIAGLDSPDSGEIFFDGHSLHDKNEEQLTRIRSHSVGIIFQQFHLLSRLTARENVALALEIISKGNDASKKAGSLLTNLGLGHRLDHLAHQLSGGECQRVAIARAFIHQPKLILADEPSGNLDAKTGEEVMQQLFEQVGLHSSTLILVTHNLDYARRCNRQYRIKDGQLVHV